MYHPAFALVQTETSPVQDKHPSIVVQSVQPVIAPVAGAFKNPYLHFVQVAATAHVSQPAKVHAVQVSVVIVPVLAVYENPDMQPPHTVVAVACAHVLQFATSHLTQVFAL